MSSCNIVLVVIDTLRNMGGEYLDSGDPFSFEGNDDFFRIMNAITPAPWTLPAHVSLFTGEYLRNHGIHESRTLKESFELFTAFADYSGTTLTEELKASGYRTYGSVANPALMPGTGFESGFEVYKFTDFLKPLSAVQGNLTKQIRANLNETEKKRFTGDSKDIHDLIRRMKIDGGTAGSEMIAEAERMTESLLDLTDSAEKIGYPELKGGNELVDSVRNTDFIEPFFLFMNFMESHDPYDIDGANITFGDGRIMLSDLVESGKISQEREKRLKENYSRSILGIRGFMSDLVASLREKDVYDNTLIILTSDHGQGFRENGFYGHGTFLYDEICRIPLSVKMPNDINAKALEEGAETAYVSLTALRKFIVGCAAGKCNPEELFQEVVFSESYGIPNNYIEMFGEGSDLVESLERIDHRRTAAFNRFGKITVNTENGEIEEISVSATGMERGFETVIAGLVDRMKEFYADDPEVKVPSEDQIREKMPS